jgi:hypothetical protein
MGKAIAMQHGTCDRTIAQANGLGKRAQKNIQP